MADILVIDDDTALRSVTRRILERHGHQVREAVDGRRGMEMLRERVPDLVITDLIMPEQEGIETIQQIRETYPELKVLAMSGGGTVDPSGPLTDAELLGADGSIAKPFGVKDLERKVAHILGARGPES